MEIKGKKYCIKKNEWKEINANEMDIELRRKNKDQ
jgi:hypothetical protein